MVAGGRLRQPGEREECGSERAWWRVDGREDVRSGGRGKGAAAGLASGLAAWPGGHPLLALPALADCLGKLGRGCHDVGGTGLLELLHAPEAPAHADAGHLGVGRGLDVDLRVAHVDGVPGPRVGLRLGAHLGQGRVHHVARGLSRDAPAHAQHGVERAGKVDVHETLHGVVALVGHHGHAASLPAQGAHELYHAGVGVRVVVAVRGVPAVELGKDGVNHSGGGSLGHAALAEAADAVAHEGAGLLECAGGQALGLQRVVEREVQVLDGVEQRSVEVEDDGGEASHARSLRVVWCGRSCVGVRVRLFVCGRSCSRSRRTS